MSVFYRTSDVHAKSFLRCARWGWPDVSSEDIACLLWTIACTVAALRPIARLDSLVEGEGEKNKQTHKQQKL